MRNYQRSSGAGEDSSGSSLPSCPRGFPMGFGMALQRYLAIVIHNPSEPFQTQLPCRPINPTLKG